MTKKKRVFSLAMALALATSICVVPASANVVETTPATIQAYSPEFPDAYIELEIAEEESQNVRTLNSNEQKLFSGTATAYVEESVEIVDDEEVIVSRLLSEEEVEVIGVDNFLEDNSAPRTTMPSLQIKEHYKLTIEFDGYIVGNNEYWLNGNAQWDGFNILYNANQNPSEGEDFFGFVWGGDFAYRDVDANATWNLGTAAPITLCEIEPNKALVWSFNEYGEDLSDAAIYVEDANIQATIYKNSLTGNGNETSCVLKYIHTYQQMVGNISFSPEEPGFSLGSTTKQWSVVLSYEEIEY